MPTFKVTIVIDASDISYALGRYIYDMDSEPIPGLISIAAEPHMPQYRQEES